MSSPAGPSFPVNTGDPIPPPNLQTHFPYRAPAGLPPQNDLNEQFADTCFEHLRDGRKKRAILIRFLRTECWEQQTRAPAEELNHFGTRHGKDDFECCFCETSFTKLAGVMKCIKAHIIYNPPN